MTTNTSAKLKYGAWGAVLGAAVTIVFGFALGGWVTSTTVGEMKAQAVLDSRAAICAAQFMQAGDHEARAEAFLNTDSWKRREFVEAGGWDRMPGEQTPRGFVSAACAEEISVALKN